MRRPEYPSALDQCRLDRLDDLASAVASLRRAVAQGDRIAVETCCWIVARRLAAAPIEGDDQDEISATVRLVEAQVKFGMHQRLRKFLLPLVTALELQIEEAEKEL
jgi:hypothetical protein